MVESLPNMQKALEFSAYTQRRRGRRRKRAII